VVSFVCMYVVFLVGGGGWGCDKGYVTCSSDSLVVPLARLMPFHHAINELKPAMCNLELHVCEKRGSEGGVMMESDMNLRTCTMQ
jgi:hypothetical protein